MDPQANRTRSRKDRNPPPSRIATAHLRRLPDFVIIGAQRGGTTSLYRSLTEHPDVGAALRKEVHFFDRYHANGLDWYRAHFPRHGEASVVGEASPYYLFHPGVPQRVREVLPQARFIALLRNPVDRAYSHYQMLVRRGVEDLSFEEAVAREPERLAGGDPESQAWRHYSYLTRGLYAEQIERWWDVFPREQLLIVKSEDLYQDTGGVVGQVSAWLGLRPWEPSDLKAYHVADYRDMDPVTRQRLLAHFAPFNRRLYDLLGRDFGWENE